MNSYPDSTTWDFVPGHEELDPVIKDFAARAAWTSLSALSGGAIAMAPITVRPCERPGAAPLADRSRYGRSFVPINYGGGVWRNCICSGACHCGVSEVVLDGPVGGIEEVRVDGVVLGPALYRLDDGRKLVRLGGGAWPRSQDLSAPLDQPGTFAITYWRGAKPNPMLNMAAGLLAREWVKARLGQNGCKLPAGTQRISRQGVDFEVSTGLFENGSTGLPEVDQIIAIYNPGRARVAPIIMSPDAMPHRQVATGPIAPTVLVGTLTGLTTPFVTSPEPTDG